MKKLLILASLLLTIPAFSRGKLQGYVERGGNSVVTQSWLSTTKVQKSFPGATVTVYSSGTTSLAVLFSDSIGTSKANPFTSDTTGFWSFYTDNPDVDIKFSGTGVTTPWTITDLRLSSSGGGGTNVFDVVTYGADPNGVADSSPGIQAAIVAACSVGGTVTVPSGTYTELTETSIPSTCTHPIILSGDPNDYGGTLGSTFKAATLGMRSSFALLDKYCKIKYIRFDANRKANYGIYLDNAVLTYFFAIHVQNGLLDGIHSDAIGLNQAIHCEQCTIQFNGKLYATAAILSQYPNTVVRQAAITGTAATVAGNAVITVSSGPDLTTLGIRTGASGDMVRVGNTASTAFWGQITSVTSSTITLQSAPSGWPTKTVSGQDYAIGIGAGWYEELSGQNGYCLFDDSILRSNGAVGLFMNGLYGDDIRNSLTDFSNFSGIAMGLISNGNFVFQPVSEHVYMEGNIGPDYVFGGVGDAKVDTPSGGSPIFSIGGAAENTTGVIIRGGVTESFQHGKFQNFLFVIQNVGGVIEHRVVSELRDGFASLLVDKVNGASTVLAVTPSGATALDSTHGFVSGAGILAAAGNFIVLDTPGGYLNGGQFSGEAVIEAQKVSSGNQATIPLRVQPDILSSANINGVTSSRLVFIITNGFTGASSDLSNGANGLPVSGDFIAIRFQGMIK